MSAEVMIVGAGSAGLAVAAALKRRGIESTVLERGPAVAMSWRNRHDRLRLNTVRQTSGLHAPRIPRTAGRWVARDAYVSYLEGFATHHKTDIRFSCDVIRVDREVSPTMRRWRVTTASGVESARHVVIATGLDRIPWMPDWPGRSESGLCVRHVAELTRAADLSGLRVLLVGAGNSGVDIAGHLVDVGVADLWVSVRTPPNVLPDEIHHVPLQLVALAGGRLPERTRDWLAQLFNRYAFGDLARYGLRQPAEGPYRHLRTTGVTVAIDRGFIAALKSGRLRIVAEIDHFDGPEVVLRDGARVRPDVVLAATGYRTGLEPIIGHLDALDDDGRPRIAPGHTSSPPGLHFIGFWPAIEGNLRLHASEAGRIARLIAR